MKLTPTLLSAAIAIASASANAEQIQGVVVDAQGNPVIGATIEVLNGPVVSTNGKGQFNVDVASNGAELHVFADGYSHQSHIVSANSAINFTLYRAAIEEIDVVGLPLHISTLESTVPVTVLDEDAMRDSQAATLGETLKGELGVNSSYYGPVSSSPIIRGLDGPRVLIAQNGLDVGDVSRSGPDHIVSTESATTQRIEVLRGPATLFFGSGAIGGVVNVIDNRVPTSNETEGSAQYTRRTVASEDELAFSLTTGSGSFAVHADGFWRDGGDYKVPSNPETHDEHEEHEEAFNGYLANSAASAKGGNVGASYLLEDGYVGVSVGRTERLYGVPGHSHGDESVKADMTQDRVQFLAESALSGSLFNQVNAKIGYTDYEHFELEGDEIGTRFTSELTEARVELAFNEFAGWRGALLADFKQVEQSSEGEEAYAPASKNTTAALALIEEKHFGDFLWQLGARVENVKLSTSPFEFEMHHDEHEQDGHDDHADEDNADEAHDEHEELLAFDSESFNPVSLSAGFVWDLAQGYNLGLSYSYAQRAPSAAELYAAGPHIGTGSYELGTQFEAHEEDGEIHIDLHATPIKLETSNNFELTYRHFEGDLGYMVNVFYNRVNDYYYAANTGLMIEAGHGHEEEHVEEEHVEEEHHDEEEMLPIYNYQQSDVELLGVEAMTTYRVSDQWQVTGQFDSVSAKLVDGGYLPRIPPMRLGGKVDYAQGNWRGQLHAMYHFEQDQTAQYEDHTEGYWMVDAMAEYQVPAWGEDTRVTFKLKNLFDESARVHTSYLKNDTLLPSRSVELSVRTYF